METFSPKQKRDIAVKFSELNTKEDILHLLNHVGSLLYGEKVKKIDLKFLTYYANPALCMGRYTTFLIKKKSGGDRVINSPHASLRLILKCFSKILESIYEPNDVAMGFISGRSIVDNARLHVGKNFIYNIDLKDFFYSFDRNKVKMALMKPPFNLNNEKEKLSFFLASLCTHSIEIENEVKIVLPQGSPTSPILTNIICQVLDRRLKGLSKRFKATYSRYADDITFSSKENIFINPEFQEELKRIIHDQQFTINSSKTRLQKRGFKQDVTGLIVNEKVNVPYKYVKQLRMWMYYIEKYGLEKAEIIFNKDYKKERKHTKNVNTPMINVLDGKLMYLKMVKGENDMTYIKLKNRYNKILGKKDNIDIVLDIWETRGIEEAMILYY